MKISGETLTDNNGIPLATETNPMFATFVQTESGEKVKTSGTTLTGNDGNVLGTTANPLIVKIQDGTTPTDPNPIRTSGTTLTSLDGEPLGTNANPIVLKSVGGTGKKIKEGTVTANGSTVYCTYYSGSVAGTMNRVTDTLNFKPSKIVLIRTSGNPSTTVYSSTVGGFYTELVTVSQHNQQNMGVTSYGFKGNVNGIVVNATSFILPVAEIGDYQYIAYE